MLLCIMRVTFCGPANHNSVVTQTSHTSHLYPACHITCLLPSILLIHISAKSSLIKSKMLNTTAQLVMQTTYACMSPSVTLLATTTSAKPLTFSVFIVLDSSCSTGHSTIENIQHNTITCWRLVHVTFNIYDHLMPTSCAVFISATLSA